MRAEKQAEIIERIAYEADRKTEPLGFARLPPIPAQRYTSSDFFKLEMDRFWSRVWLPVARLEEVKNPGDFIVWRKLRKPIIVIRGKDETVRAFYNTCQHRGAAVTSNESGHVSLLRCQFHSWCYDLTGRLLTVPDLRDFPGGIDKDQFSLKAVRCEVLDGEVHVNLDDNAPPLARELAPIADELACLETEKLRIVHRHKWIIDANWKACLDAFQETYHLRTVHRNSFGKAYNQDATAIGLMPYGHSRMVIDYLPGALEVIMSQRSPDTPDIPGTTQLNRDHSITYTIFPNRQMTVRAAMVFENRFWPIAPDKTEVDFIAIAPDWGDGPLPEYWQKAAPLNVRFIEEDLENLHSIQQSLESGALQGMTINYQERRIYWTQEVIDRVIGPENIPPELRIVPMLDRFVEPIEDFQ